MSKKISIENPQFVKKNLFIRSSKMLRLSTSRKGKPAITNVNNFSYVQNGPGSKETTPCRCSIRKCPAKIRTRKSTGNLVGDLPHHIHGSQLLAALAKQTEKEVINRYATVEGVRATTVLQEISNSMMNSSFPGQIASASTSGAIRMKLYRQHQSINPRPKVTGSYHQNMDKNVPDQFM